MEVIGVSPRDAAAQIVRWVRRRVRLLLARILRRLMFRTTVIAITGSVGKSTTKECLAAIMDAHGGAVKTPGNYNGGLGASRAILRWRPWHRYAIIEIGTETPGTIWPTAKLVKPDIAIVLCVAGTHHRSFPTLDDTAAEKATLLDALPPDGIAILNGDDPRVRRMAEGRPQRVIFFGQGPDCDVVARDVASAWPDRLHFTLRSDAEELPVQTQLVGKHWVSSALAAIAAAKACGVASTEIIRSLGEVAPFSARMQPVQHPSGAIVIRDESSSSVDTLAPMFEVMREARAERRVLVFSDISETEEHTRDRLRNLGRTIAEFTELAVFTTKSGNHAILGAEEAGMSRESCRHVPDLRQAAALLKQELRAGDLVFVKGRVTDHLTRVVLSQYGSIGCWTTNCQLRMVCEECTQLRPEFNLQETLAASVAATRDAASLAAGATEQT